MGITGLLPLLEKAKVSRPANLKEFQGCTVAADAYCWLHKGAFACADKLARGEETDMYVQYCMKYVNMLLAHDIKPILVFDGRHLPAKAHTEKKRRERREENRKTAANLLRQGNTTEGLNYLRRCIDVTHKMALTLMQECRRRNVDCIVAPYEADAQLAFFSREGIADVIITEDSDLLLFGCKKVMFKLDLAGNGIFVDQERLYLSMGPRPQTYSFDKFRYMCILSGCDYLDSLQGIGLGKASKFITRTQDPDIHKALSRLPSQLNIRGLTVSMEYRDEFMKADAMFRHQLVFDPLTRKPKPLTPHRSVHPGSPLACGPLPGCVPEFDEDTSYQLALGNLDPFKLEKVDSYDPMSPRDPSQGVRTKGWNQTAVAPHPSIWDPKFKEKMTKPPPRVVPSFMPNERKFVNKEKIEAVDTNKLANKNKKRILEEDDMSVDAKRRSLDVRDSILTSIYTSPDHSNDQSSASVCESYSPEVQESPTSPILCSKRTKNPFVRSPQSTNVSDNRQMIHPDTPVPSSTKQTSKFSALSKFARAVHRTSIEGKPIVQSRYFGSTSTGSDESAESHSLLRDVSNTLDDSPEKEFNVMEIYKKTPEERIDSPRIHRKPLFASMSSSIKDSPANSDKTSSKSGSFSKDDAVKIMNEKFAKQDCAPKLQASPSKNPFKKNVPSPSKIVADENCASGSFVDEEQPFEHRQIYANDYEDADDPGFESSTSLTPCSPTNVPSQPDDGFESPSKGHNEAKTARLSKQPTPSNRKLTCRTPGLKKKSPTVQGQSKLSAFGFMPKSKLQRS
ncbi:exonuclease 1 isoform X2 [Thrips palmi]|uniref:Exonuclease 1 n=1 Tax=Thrips palmi TaxID=161013 RepID=A0A6P8ZT78_THRPL|nr:exonuclease 1 isoform X2 [Thrips palmi]